MSADRKKKDRQNTKEKANRGFFSKKWELWQVPSLKFLHNVHIVCNQWSTVVLVTWRVSVNDQWLRLVKSWYPECHKFRSWRSIDVLSPDNIHKSSCGSPLVADGSSHKTNSRKLLLEVLHIQRLLLFWTDEPLPRQAEENGYRSIGLIHSESSTK